MVHFYVSIHAFWISCYKSNKILFFYAFCTHFYSLKTRIRSSSFSFSGKYLPTNLILSSRIPLFCSNWRSLSISAFPLPLSLSGKIWKNECQIQNCNRNASNYNESYLYYAFFLIRLTVFKMKMQEIHLVFFLFNLYVIILLFT